MEKINRLKAFIPTIMPEKAKDFYLKTMSLKLISEDDYGYDFEAESALLRVIRVKSFTPQQFTVLGWKVNNIKERISFLTQQGVIFEKYDFLEQDELGIWTAPGGTKVAWFKDPDGNILSLDQ